MEFSKPLQVCDGKSRRAKDLKGIHDHEGPCMVEIHRTIGPSRVLTIRESVFLLTPNHDQFAGSFVYSQRTTYTMNQFLWSIPDLA